MSVQHYIYDVIVCDDNGGNNIHDEIFNNRQDAIEYCNANGILSDKVRCFGRSEYWMEADEEEREQMILCDAWDWDTEVVEINEDERKERDKMYELYCKYMDWRINKMYELKNKI